MDDESPSGAVPTAPEAARTRGKTRPRIDPLVELTLTRARALTYRFDPARPESRLARLEVDAAVERALGRADAVEVREETETQPGARYIDWLVPGLIGMNLMGSGMWGLGFAVVMKRKNKL